MDATDRDGNSTDTENFRRVVYSRAAVREKKNGSLGGMGEGGEVVG